MDEEPKLITTRNLVIMLTLALLLGSAVSFLADLRLSDSDAFRVTHHGAIPVVANDDQAVNAANTAMMPLMPE